MCSNTQSRRFGFANLLIILRFTEFGDLMGKLTTHVLDTESGRPGSGAGVKLYALEDERRLVAATVTNDDGVSRLRLFCRASPVECSR